MAMSSFKSVTLLCCSCYLLLVAFGQQVWAAPQPEGAVPEVPLKNGASSTGKPMGESPKAGSPQKDHDQSEEEELPGDEAAVFHLFEFEHDIKALIKSIRKDVTSYPSRGPEDDCSSSNMTDVKSGVELPVCKQEDEAICVCVKPNIMDKYENWCGRCHLRFELDPHRMTLIHGLVVSAARDDDDSSEEEA